MSRREHYQLQFGTHIGPAQLYKTEFPTFKGGDVQVIISGSRQYLLHASILKNISPRLREMLNDQRAAKLSSKAVKRGVTTRFRIVALENPKGVNDEERIPYVLELIELNEEGKPTTHRPIPLDLENGLAVQPIFLAYHAVLGAFYNIPINLGDFERDCMTDILTTAINITLVAEYLQCVQIITKPIEATLLAVGQIFQQSITNNPCAWLEFAYRVKSRAIFREALIHCTGKFNTKEVRTAIDGLKPAIRDVLVKKATGLKEAVRAAQLNILSFYPQHMQRERTVGRVDKDSIGRASYANDIFSWVALVILRHWAMQSMAFDKTHHSEDLGYQYVKVITDGGDAYLDRTALTEFHRYFPMSPKAESVVESKLSEMKEHIKRFVMHLTKNESQLDIRSFPAQHFTCTIVDVCDYPWDTGIAASNGSLEDRNDLKGAYENEGDTEDDAEAESNGYHDDDDEE